MTIYIIIVLFATLTDFRYRMKGTKASKKKMCIIFSMILFLLIGLREKRVGNDTYNYYDIFIHAGRRTIEKILDGDYKDFLFSILCHGMYSIKAEFQWLLLLVSAVYTSATMIYLYKKSINPLMSIVVLFAFNFIQFSMTGLRQTLAMGLLTFAYMAFLNKKHFLAISLILLSGFFHKSAWCFFVIYALQFAKVDKRRLIISVFVILIVYAFKPFIAGKLMFLISERGYELAEEISGGETMFMVLLVYYIIAIVFYNDSRSHDRDDIYRMMFLGLCFQALVPAQNIFFRIGMYFYFTIAVLIPRLIADVPDKKSRRIVLVTVYALLLIQYFGVTIGSANVVPYRFFWQSLK